MKNKKEKTYCDNCSREQKVYRVILAYESGVAYYCKDCIKNNPHVREDTESG